MGETTKIEWTDHTFNPWIGCTKISPACDGCYAENLMDHRYGRVSWGAGEDRKRTAPATWRKPIAWNKAAALKPDSTYVFCASLADVFDNEVAPEWRDDLFALIKATPALTWLLLTKRIGNVLKMMARMPASSFKRSAWLVNQDVLPQLGGLAMDVTKADGTAAGAGILYMQPQGLANQSAFGSILGRPIIVTEACQTVGTAGDIVLADMSKYLSVVKGGLKTDYSIHLWFDQDLTAFKFTLRIGGQPWWASSVASRDGSFALSPFVTLAAR